MLNSPTNHKSISHPHHSRMALLLFYHHNSMLCLPTGIVSLGRRRWCHHDEQAQLRACRALRIYLVLVLIKFDTNRRISQEQFPAAYHLTLQHFLQSKIDIKQIN